MNTIDEFKTNFIENLEQTIFESTSNIPLTRVYVSIGSKLNEKQITNTQYEHWYSNALDQMFPVFMYDSCENVCNNSLIVIIDKFNAVEYSNNELILMNRLKNVKHTHIVIFNTLCTEKLLMSFLPYLTNMCKQNQISSQNLMICNYTKFASIPNKLEKERSIFISPLIDKLLSKTHIYKQCLYEWFGYDYTMYNFVYKYNKSFNIQDNNGYRILKRILANFAPPHIYQTKITNVEVRDFCESLYDITKYSDANISILSVPVLDNLQ
jgi:hypothetical protein